MSLPQSALHCSSHLSPTYIFCTITLLFALSKHTHTHTQAQAHYLALFILTSTSTLYIFFCTIHTSSTRSLSSWTLSKSLHITIGSDPFPVSGNTLCENVLLMCMYCICDLC